jgi:hypothetical protein
VDAATVIEAALVAGAVAGVRDSATAAVKSGYEALKNLVLGRVETIPDGVLIVTRHAEDSTTWQAPLRRVLESSGAGADEELVSAADELLRLIKADQPTPQVVVTASGKGAVAVGGNAGDINTGNVKR